MKDLIRRSSGPLLLTICAICLSVQVLVRPAIGIANNGDFAKMAGAVSLGPENGTWNSHKQYGEFLYRYVRADHYGYNRDFRKAEFLSSEFFFVKLARGMQRIFQPGPRFDIRWLGSVNGAFFLFAIGIWIYAIPPRWRLCAGPLLIFIWTDVAYVQYLNSFYMDTAAMVFLILCVAAGLHVMKDRKNRMFPLLMTLASILFAASKSQHAVPALLFLPLFLALAFWSGDRATRATWIAGSVLLFTAAGVVLGRATAQYRSTPLFNVVFFRLAPQAPDPLHTLEELGLGKDELPLLHTDAYFSHSPLLNSAWVRRFHLRCNYATLLGYYFRHPSVAAHFIYQDLSGPAARIRPWGNLSPDDKFKADAQAAHFGYWSDVRAFLLKHAPWHVILLAVATITIALWLLFRSPVHRAFAGLVLVLQALAAMECAIAILADAAETDRHLMIFHVATEISILLLPPLLFCIRIALSRITITNK